MIRENPWSPYLPASRSLATDCGVETTTSDPSTTAALVSGFKLPFISPTLAPTRRVVNVSLCWSTSGFVGARTRTFPLSRNSAANLSATIVLPSPVGSIRSEVLSRHPLTMLVWYLRSSTVSGTMRGCLTYAM